MNGRDGDWQMSRRATILSAAFASYLVAAPCVGIAVAMISACVPFPHDASIVAALMVPSLLFGLLFCAGGIIMAILERAGLIR